MAWAEAGDMAGGMDGGRRRHGGQTAAYGIAPRKNNHRAPL